MQVCLLIEDTEFEPGVWDGEAVKVGRFAGSMRRFLMKEHLGLLGEAGDDRGDRSGRQAVIMANKTSVKLQYK